MATLKDLGIPQQIIMPATWPPTPDDIAEISVRLGGPGCRLEYRDRTITLPEGVCGTRVGAHSALFQALIRISSGRIAEMVAAGVLSEEASFDAIVVLAIPGLQFSGLYAVDVFGMN